MRPAPSQKAPAGAGAPVTVTSSLGFETHAAPRPASSPGFQQMSYAAYDEHPALRRSHLEKMRQSPLHFQHFLEHGDTDTAALTVGRALHTLILEPELAKDRIAVFEGAARRGKAWDEFEAANRGKDILRKDEYDDALEQRASFYRNPVTRDLLKDRLVEASAIWTDAETGIACKARLDIVSPGLIVDIKTARDVSDYAMSKAAHDFGYFRQAPWYQDAAEAVIGETFDRFYLVVIEKTAPFVVRTFLLEPKSIELGRAQNREALRTYARCKANGEWPGPSSEPALLMPPRWVQ